MNLIISVSGQQLNQPCSVARVDFFLVLADAAQLVVFAGRMHVASLKLETCWTLSLTLSLVVWSLNDWTSSLSHGLVSMECSTVAQVLLVITEWNPSQTDVLQQSSRGCRSSLGCRGVWGILWFQQVRCRNQTVRTDSFYWVSLQSHNKWDLMTEVVLIGASFTVETENRHVIVHFSARQTRIISINSLIVMQLWH